MLARVSVRMMRGSGRRVQIVIAVLAITIVFFGVVPLVGQAGQGRPNAEVAEEAIGQLRSPYCPGLMLEVCPSAPAAALRDSIYDLAAEGASAQELVEWMLARHGEEWRGVPERSGLGLWAWLMPPLALLVGIAVVVGWLRANRAEPAQAGEAESLAVSDQDRDRVAAALREWEESGEEEV